MPCYTSVLNSVDLGRMGTGDKLKAALVGIGAEVSVDSSGRVTGFFYGRGWHDVSASGLITAGSRVASTAGLESLKGQVRVSYSAEIVKAQAKRNGWVIKKVSANRYQAVKRGA